MKHFCLGRGYAHAANPSARTANRMIVLAGLLDRADRVDP